MSRTYRGTRTGGRSARVRDAVLQAALVELVDHGYDAYSLPRVAERAEVALSTIHRRWGTKSRLIADALTQTTAVQVPDPQGADLRTDLLALATAIAAMLRDPVTLTVLRTAFALPEDELAELRAAHWAPRIEVAQRVIDRAIERGELPADTNGWAVVEPIYARIWMRLLITGLPVDDVLLERLVDAALDAAQRGVVISPALERH